MNDRLLKVFPSQCWHDTVHIVGDREALKLLANRIQRALNSKAGCSYIKHEEAFFETDGEGFEVIVVEATEEEMDQLPMQYSDTQLTGEDTRMIALNEFLKKKIKPE